MYDSNRRVPSGWIEGKYCVYHPKRGSEGDSPSTSSISSAFILMCVILDGPYRLDVKNSAEMLG